MKALSIRQSPFPTYIARTRRRRESESLRAANSADLLHHSLLAIRNPTSVSTRKNHHAIIAQKTSGPTGLPQAAHLRAGAGGGRCRPTRDLPALPRRPSPLAPLPAARLPAPPLPFLR